MNPRTILITGANSGLGYETARQLAGRTDVEQVVLGARSQHKADDARRRLVQQTASDTSRFDVLICDNTRPETIVAAVHNATHRFDALVLNAGGAAALGADGAPTRSESGYTDLYMMNVGGHALLVDELLRAERLSDGATIIFAGTEGSIGIPALRANPPTLPEGFADQEAALKAQLQGRLSEKYDVMSDYGMVKLVGVMWMRYLYEEHGLRALTVSPGNTWGTAGIKKLPTLPRLAMTYLGMPLMRLFGAAHDVEKGAQRYVRALFDHTVRAPGFYASPPNRMSGALTRRDDDPTQPLLRDSAFHEAVKRVVQDSIDAAQSKLPSV